MASTQTAAGAATEPREVRFRPSIDRVFGVVTPLSLLLVWEILSLTGVLDARIFSSPTRVVILGWQLIANGTLLEATWATLARFFLGMLLGVIPGTFIGITMGLFRWPRAMMNPIVKAIYPLPRVALFPLVILILGRGEMSFAFMVALGPFFAMLVASMGGVMNVDPVYLKVARSFKVNNRDLYRRVVFPAALPVIFSGFRISLGFALMGVVAVEFLLANNGLGFLIWRSWEILSLGQSMVGLVATGILGYSLFVITDWLEERTVPWATTN